MKGFTEEEKMAAEWRKMNKKNESNIVSNFMKERNSTNRSSVRYDFSIVERETKPRRSLQINKQEERITSDHLNHSKDTLEEENDEFGRIKQETFRISKHKSESRYQNLRQSDYDYSPEPRNSNRNAYRGRDSSRSRSRDNGEKTFKDSKKSISSAKEEEEEVEDQVYKWRHDRFNRYEPRYRTIFFFF
jgi:hypothetical protein